MNIIIDSKELKRLLSTTPDLIIIDVRLASDFENAHLPGALNNCVYEMAFAERLSAIAPEKNKPLCVYGAGPKSFESRMAAEKLHRAGYTAVYDFQAGLESWKKEGLSIEKIKTPPSSGQPPPPLQGKRPIDLIISKIEWVGRNLASKHHGTLNFQSGFMNFQDGNPIGGSLVIDMNSITNQNLAEQEGRKILEEHLKSDDFFDVRKYPHASLQLKSLAPIENTTNGMPNFKITAQLTLKGIANSLEFIATARINENGQWVAQANFDFDRTQWNIIYGSGKFFQNLGMHLVNDLISLQIKIVA